MRNIAIIPARSGSKGLKDKNIKLLNGKPLLAYSIEAALQSGIFEEVMVSTDSEQYAEIAKQFGANVPFLRSEINSEDCSSSWDVVREVLEGYEIQGKIFDTITLLQPTSPLRTSKDIVNGFKLMEQKKADSVVSVCECDHSPLWMNTLPEDLSLASFIDKTKSGPRQNLPIYYRINGALYIIKKAVLENLDLLYGPESYAYIMKPECSVDIDTALDFCVAEALMSLGRGERDGK